MQFDNLNSNEDDGLISIEDLYALPFQKQKILSDKKTTKYFLESIQDIEKLVPAKITFKENELFKKAA